MKPALVVLAAGLARRFGRLKQLEPLGPAGETLLDFSIYDAIRGGFGQIVIVSRRETLDAFQAHFRRAWPDLPVHFAFQEPGTGGAPESVVRTRPWGTAQAVLAAAPHVRGPFAVMNADDFYGSRTIAMMAAHLRGGHVHSEFFVAGYPLRTTLSERGGVSRGILEVDDHGRVLRIRELTNVRREGDCIVGERDGRTETLDADTPVSLNFWGFTPLAFRLIGARFRAFVERAGDDPEIEYALPDAIGEIVESHAARVRLLPSQDEWLGITHAEDKPDVERRLRKLVEAGVYPQRLAAPVRPE